MITLEQIQNVASMLEEHKVKPLIVKSRKQANLMTEITHINWQVGDKFYTAYYKDTQFFSKV